MIVKYKKEIEISSLSTLKNPPNCPELSAPIIFRRPHGMADTDDNRHVRRGGRGRRRVFVIPFLIERQNNFFIILP